MGGGRTSGDNGTEGTETSVDPIEEFLATMVAMFVSNHDANYYHAHTQKRKIKSRMKHHRLFSWSNGKRTCVYTTSSEGSSGPAESRIQRLQCSSRARIGFVNSASTLASSPPGSSEPAESGIRGFQFSSRARVQCSKETQPDHSHPPPEA